MTPLSLRSSRSGGSRSRRAARSASGRRRGTRTDADRGSSAALVTLRSEDLIVERPHRHPMRLPSIEVVRGRDRAAHAIALAHRPVLVEGLRSLDRWRVRPDRLVDLVGASIRGHRAQRRETRAGVVIAERIGDIIFYEWACSPPVDGEVGVAAGAEASAVCYGPANIESAWRSPVLNKYCLLSTSCGPANSRNDISRGCLPRESVGGS